MELIEQGHLDPSSIIAVLGKTEGNGGSTITREYAVAALRGRAPRRVWGSRKCGRGEDRRL